MSHEEWKHKHGKIIKKNQIKEKHLRNMVGKKSSEQIKENFYRPAYGKIGERSEWYYDN